MDTTNNPFTPAVQNLGPKPPVIKVIGVGGGGNNAINHMIRQGMKGVEFIAVNTDIIALKRSEAPFRIQLGERGTGAGTNPDIARQLALAAREVILEAIQGADMLFIAAGMGGGTGTGAAPVIAELARELNIITVAVVTKPFSSEGPRKMAQANEGIEKIEKMVNSMVLVLNDKLKKELPPNVLMQTAREAADNVLYNAVSGVSDIIAQEGEFQLDFADVCAVMEQGGMTMMGSAMAEGDNRAINAAEMALRSPLLEGIEMKDALGALVYVAASVNTLGLDEFDTVVAKIQSCSSDSAIVKAGLVYDEKLEGKIKVTVLITGLGREQTPMNRPVPRHSHGIPREDARGNPIAPLQAMPPHTPTTPTPSTSAPSGGNPHFNPPAFNGTQTLFGSNRALGTTSSSPPHEFSAPPRAYAPETQAIDGVIRTNQTRYKSVNVDPARASDGNQTTNPLGSLINKDASVSTPHRFDKVVSGADSASNTLKKLKQS
jgi:cell division protein FtsZ